MSKTCADCVYHQAADQTCRHNAPGVGTVSNKAQWVTVSDSDWCAEGYNDGDGYYDAAPISPAQHYTRAMRLIR